MDNISRPAQASDIPIDQSPLPQRTLTEDEVKTFESGAKRENWSQEQNWEQIPFEGMERLAARYALGAAKYGYGNWTNGLPFSNLIKHALRHMFLYIKGDKSDDHLAAICWCVMTIMWEEANKEYLDDRMYREFNKEKDIPPFLRKAGDGGTSHAP